MARTIGHERVPVKIEKHRYRDNCGERNQIDKDDNDKERAKWHFGAPNLASAPCKRQLHVAVALSRDLAGAGA